TASYTSRGYGRGEMRYRTESRDDIVLPKPDDRPPPSIRKGERGLSRRPREEESERAIRGNLAEDRLPRARRHRDPQLPVYFWPLWGGIGWPVRPLAVIRPLTLGGGDSPPNPPPGPPHEFGPPPQAGQRFEPRPPRLAKEPPPVTNLAGALGYW